MPCLDHILTCDLWLDSDSLWFSLLVRLLQTDFRPTRQQVVLTANKRKSKRKSKSRAGSFSLLSNDKKSQPLQVRLPRWSTRSHVEIKQGRKPSFYFACRWLELKEGWRRSSPGGAARADLGLSLSWWDTVNMCFFFFPENRFKTATQYSRGVLCVLQGDPQNDGQTDRPNTSTLARSGAK